MQLELKRQKFTDSSTIGELSVNGAFECWTLEDTVRKTKIAGITAIPQGRYEVVVTFSNRFQKPMPLLIGVPGFEGIRIHSGNCCEDTEGCLLVGRTKGPNFVGESRLAFTSLFKAIQAAIKKEKVFINVR